MEEYKLLKYIDNNKLLRFKDLKEGFLKNEVTLVPALNIELQRYAHQGLIKRHRGLIVDLDHIYITAKGIRLCRLLYARDRVDQKIMECLNGR